MLDLPVGQHRSDIAY
ncbi:unnamed protein product [Victoria cruziana]